MKKNCTIYMVILLFIKVVICEMKVFTGFNTLLFFMYISNSGQLMEYVFNEIIFICTCLDNIIKVLIQDHLTLK